MQTFVTPKMSRHHFVSSPYVHNIIALNNSSKTTITQQTHRKTRLFNYLTERFSNCTTRNTFYSPETGTGAKSLCCILRAIT